MKLLVTFGCSWTFGTGVGYYPGITLSEYKLIFSNPDLCKKSSFRTIISETINADNINFSLGASSNQTQFRLAEQFFCSNYFKQCQEKYSEIIVLWGITSVYRNEAYFLAEQNRRSYFYTDKSNLSKIYITEHFDLDDEVSLLANKMHYWNKFFKSVDVKNLWFDTFNHHRYNESRCPAYIKKLYNDVAGPEWPSWLDFEQYNLTHVPDSIMNEITDPQRWPLHYYTYDATENVINGKQKNRDLLSYLVELNGGVLDDSGYHMSEWNTDCDRISFLTNCGILNPYSYHLTKEGHLQIANMLVDILTEENK